MDRDVELLFWYKVSSEEGLDFFLFFVNDELEARGSGELDWAQAHVSLAAESHRVRGEYAKDRADSRGKDTAHREEVVFPLGCVFVAPAPPVPPGMVHVPAGSFRLGDSLAEGDPDELPVHTV